MSTSITEIKLLIMLHVDKKFIWWMHLFKKLEFSSNHQMILDNNNTQTIRLFISEISKVDTKLRHADVAQCWLRKTIQRDVLNVKYLLIANMIVDEMTKMLSLQKHKKFIKQLSLMNTKNLIEMNDATSSNWNLRLCENRVIINIKKIRWRKNRFLRVFDFSMQLHFNHASISAFEANFKSLFEAISGLFNYLNVIN
jgi:hypothetical protein